MTERSVDDALDELMRDIADKEPNSIERSLLESNLSKEDRLRVGHILRASVENSIVVDNIRRWLIPLYEKGRAGRPDLNRGLHLLVTEATWQQLLGRSEDSS